MSGTAQILKNAMVRIGPADNATEPTNISCQVTQVTMNLTQDVLEVTPICETAKVKIVGLKDSTFALEANQDFTSGAIDEILFNAYNAQTLLSLHVRPSASAIGASNPEYRCRIYLSEYSPFNGKSTGEDLTTSVNFASAGNVMRHTS